MYVVSYRVDSGEGSAAGGKPDLALFHSLQEMSSTAHRSRPFYTRKLD